MYTGQNDKKMADAEIWRGEKNICCMIKGFYVWLKAFMCDKGFRLKEQSEIPSQKSAQKTQRQPVSERT